MSTTTTFANSTPITIPGFGAALPSTVNVTGLYGNLNQIEITLTGLAHHAIQDLDMLLVGPDGSTHLVFWSDVGYGSTSGTFKISDAAATQFPIGSNFTSGTYQPTDNDGALDGTGDTFTNYGGAVTASAGPDGGGATLNGTFSGIDPNGTWTLYIVDDFATGAGNLASWSITITTVVPPPPEPPNPNELIYGTAGADVLVGNDGDDTIIAGDGDDVVYGNQDNDLIEAEQGNDTVFGGQGNDTVNGREGDDVIHGNAGDDVLAGNEGDDVLAGGAGQDILYGNQGNDVLLGNEGNDIIFGGAGDDTIYGGQGDDTLAGNAGADRFVFGASSGVDIVQDFSFAEGDRPDLMGQSFTQGKAADGSIVLTLSGGGSITLAGVTTFSAGFVI